MSDPKVIVMVLILVAGTVAAQQSDPRPTSGVTGGTTQVLQDETLFNPNRKKALSYRDGELVLNLINGKKSLAVDIENTGQAGGRIELSPEIVQVNEIRGVQNGKAVVIGMVNGSVFEVVVLNIRLISVADQFFAYSPAVSPDGRFIAFVKFYPPTSWKAPTTTTCSTISREALQTIAQQT